jgi:HD-GYP domain-containing protein (c-di-GMP phosphodiesterase class II)
VSQIEQLRDVIPVIRWHHEALDGSGYPDGLDGSRIPLLARIVAVGDTLDAITTDRPYQRGCSAEQALARIQELVGRRFDAKVVSAFLSAFDAGDIELPERPPSEEFKLQGLDLSVSH